MAYWKGPVYYAFLRRWGKYKRSTSHCVCNTNSNECHHLPVLPEIHSVKSHVITGTSSWTTTGTATWREASRKTTRESTTKSSRHSTTKLRGQLCYNSTDFGIVLVFNDVGWIGGYVLEGSCHLWILSGKQTHTVIRTSHAGNWLQKLHQTAWAND